MADGELRPVWRGQLRLALVSCPVALYSAHHEAGSLHFNLLNPRTGNRIRTVVQDSETGAELERKDLVRGYEYRKGAWLTLTDEDFEAARVESSSTLRVERFVPAASIDPIWFDASYYLAPDGEAGEDVYRVLWAAISEREVAALSRVVIARRERQVAFLPMDDLLVAHTLHEARDLNDFARFAKPLHGMRPDKEMVKLAVQLIDRQQGRYDPAEIEDRYETRLRALIAAKLKGEKLTAAAEEEYRSNVVDLMAALKQSLAGNKPARRKPAAAKRRRAS